MEARRHAPIQLTVMTGLDDDDRTLGGVGAATGMAQLGEFTNALPPATRLNEFEVLSVIGQGGFGIVYLAHDLTLDRKVAIKEYMPSALATRTQAMTVAANSDRHRETFSAGLRSFVNEARLLARFDHPSLLKVHRFWEAHGTAYMVMPYYEGFTLGTLLKRLGAPPDEATLKALLHPLLDALELMHSAHCYHRDIAPDNILILPDGRPMLLDFGAARRVIGDMTQALTVILKTGYAPVEQYGDIPDMSQGAWTDLYALGSVVQFAITGRTPPQALTRFMEDRREPLAQVAAGRYGDEFLRAMDCTLAVLPKNRPQSVAELRSLLGAGFLTPPHGPADALDRMSTLPAALDAPLDPPAPDLPGRTHKLPQHEERSAPTLQRWSQPSPEPDSQPPAASEPPVPPPATPAPQARLRAEPGAYRPAVVAGAAALLALAAAAAGFAWWSPRHPGPVEPTASSTPPASPVAASATPTAAAAPPTPDAPEPPRLQAPPPTLPALAVQDERPATGAADAPVPAAEAAPPPRAAAPRAPRAAAPDAPPAQRKAVRNLSSGRCADIIQRVSIGEELSDAEKTLLKQECGK
jgi:serine/threonine protein kinase